METVSHRSSGSTVLSDGMSAGEVREQLKRIIHSEAFKRSQRSQAFLSYITQTAIAGGEATINEHMIGIEVFQRGPKYNPSEDAVVRRHAHSLRQRLETYYKSEGQDDEILIDVPIGHYVPIFRRRTPEEGHSSPGVLPNAASGLLPVWAWIALVVFGAAVAFTIGVGVSSEGPFSDPSPSLKVSAVRELWEPWLASGQGPQVCFSSPYGAVVKHYMTRLPEGSQPPRLELKGDTERAFRNALHVGDSGYLYVSPTINEAKSGESLGGVLLANFFGMNGLRTTATLSRLLTWDDFRRQNLILLGHSEQNRWVGPFLEEYPLRLAETSGSRKRRVVNVRPTPEEASYFEIEYALHEDEATVEYALVSMLPGTDSRHRLLIVSGLNTQATLMGIEFLLDAVAVQDLLGRFRVLSPEHSGPWYFQMVLKTEVREKVPTGASVEMIRVLDTVPTPQLGDTKSHQPAT